MLWPLPHSVVCVSSVSHVWLFVVPWTVARQAPLSIESFRQEYWSRLTFPTLDDLSDPGIEPALPKSPALAGDLQHFGTPRHLFCCSIMSYSLTPWTVACKAPLSMGILQARILEWFAMPSSRGSSQPRDWTQVSQLADRFLIVWASRETQEYSSG